MESSAQRGFAPGRPPILLLSLAGLLLAPAAHAGYSFVGLVDSSGPFAGFGQGPVQNDSGQFAFEGTLDTGEHGIYTGPDPTTDTLVNDSGSFVSFGDQSINGSGDVAFFACVSNAPSVCGNYRGPNPATDTVADNAGPYSGFSAFRSITDSGDVYFTATRDGGGSGIYTGPDPVLDVVIDDSGPYGLFGDVMANDVGGIVFSADLDAGGFGIFTGPNPATDAVATNAGPYSAFSLAVINNLGDVVFGAFLDAGGTGLFSGDDPTTDTLVDSSGAYSTFSTRSLNDQGDLAFLAFLDAGGRGIFTGPDAVNDKVIATGDSLFGSTVTDVSLTPESLDDQGDVIFRYVLANGSGGIAVAIVPEPATGLLVALGLAGLAAARRRTS